MKVDTKEVNPAFESIIQDPEQIVFLDANFFIPPDRSNYPTDKRINPDWGSFIKQMDELYEDNK